MPGINLCDTRIRTGTLTDNGARHFFRPAELKNWVAWRFSNFSYTNESQMCLVCNCCDMNNSPSRRFLLCNITAGVGNPFPRGVERKTCKVSSKVFPSLCDLMKDSFTVWTVRSTRPFERGYSGLDVVWRMLKRWQNWRNSAESNCFPLSDTNCSGIPKSIKKPR